MRRRWLTGRLGIEVVRGDKEVDDGEMEEDWKMEDGTGEGEEVIVVGQGLQNAFRLSMRFSVASMGRQQSSKKVVLCFS